MAHETIVVILAGIIAGLTLLLVLKQGQVETLEDDVLWWQDMVDKLLATSKKVVAEAQKICDENARLLKREPKTVRLDKEKFIKHNWYTDWYDCPECGINSITYEFRVCPFCEVKLDWSDETGGEVNENHI